jgi:hypothetical protein
MVSSSIARVSGEPKPTETILGKISCCIRRATQTRGQSTLLGILASRCSTQPAGTAPLQRLIPSESNRLAPAATTRGHDLQQAMSSALAEAFAAVETTEMTPPGRQRTSGPVRWFRTSQTRRRREDPPAAVEERPLLVEATH